MNIIEEHFAVLCDTNRKDGITGHDSPHDDHVRPCPACTNVRAAMLVAHMQVCRERKYYGPRAERGYCGDDWYCPKAMVILELGKVKL